MGTTISSSSENVEPNETITLTILYNGIFPATSHSIYINNVHYADIFQDVIIDLDNVTYPITFDTEGEYEIYVITSAIENVQSNTITITVSEEPTLLEAQELTIGQKTIQSLTINNKKVYSIVRSSDNAILYQLTELNTNLTINVPLSLVYSDAFNITGVLTDENNQVLASQTVKLKVGNTVVDIATTNSNGEYSFTQTPVSTGNHSFQVIFEGTSNYFACESSVVNRTIGKETTVININNITTQHEGDDVYINGVLLSDDGEPIANATIYFSKDNVSQGSVTTNANGTFTKTITGHHN